MTKVQKIGIGVVAFGLLIYPSLITLFNKLLPLIGQNFYIGVGQFFFGIGIIGWGIYLIVKPIIPNE